MAYSFHQVQKWGNCLPSETRNFPFTTKPFMKWKRQRNVFFGLILGAYLGDLIFGKKNVCQYTLSFFLFERIGRILVHWPQKSSVNRFWIVEICRSKFPVMDCVTIIFMIESVLVNHGIKTLSWPSRLFFSYLFDHKMNIIEPRNYYHLAYWPTIKRKIQYPSCKMEGPSPESKSFFDFAILCRICRVIIPLHRCNPMSFVLFVLICDAWEICFILCKQRDKSKLFQQQS